jgi:hypothetical protein
MKMNEFFEVFSYVIYGEYQMCPKVVCKDGFEMSVQASASHYCSPRETIVGGPYAAFEIGFPSEAEESIIEYAEDASDPSDTVYGWVPVGKIDALIEKHGGIDLKAVIANVKEDTKGSVENNKVSKRYLADVTIRGYSKDEVLEIMEVLKQS